MGLLILFRCHVFIFFKDLNEITLWTIIPVSYTHLEKLGAHVVYPERDMALKIAQKILRRNLVDYISIGKDAEIIEIQMTSGMIGKSIIDMKIREKFHLNIVAIQCMGTTTTEIDPYYQFQNNDTMVAIGKRKSVSDFIDYYS